MIYLVQTGADDQLKVEQFRRVMTLFFSPATLGCFGGHVLQIPSGTKEWAPEYNRLDVWAELAERKIEDHVRVFHSIPQYVYVDYEPEPGPNGELFLLGEGISYEAAKRLQAQYEIIGSTIPNRGIWSLPKHGGHGHVFPEDRDRAEALYHYLELNTQFINYYPRIKDADHELIVSNYQQEGMINGMKPMPVVQYRIAHRRMMMDEDAYRLTKAVLDNHDDLVIWMEANNQLCVDIWNEFHLSVACGVSRAIREYAGV